MSVFIWVRHGTTVNRRILGVGCLQKLMPLGYLPIQLIETVAHSLRYHCEILKCRVNIPLGYLWIFFSSRFSHTLPLIEPDLRLQDGLRKDWPSWIHRFPKSTNGPGWGPLGWWIGIQISCTTDGKEVIRDFSSRRMLSDS